ncbi:MAG: hypoxanthine phosphoribosyltransferase [Candidatus Limnocylindria bacterium]
MTIHDDVEEILISGDAIADRVAELGAQLTADYAGRDPVLVSVLKGSLMFLADLMRAMEVPVSIDLMEVSSYGAGTETSGQVRILKDLSMSIEGRDVIVVEDIIDTGLTLNYLLKYLADKGPATMRIVCLLDKPARRLAEIPIDYRGFTIPDRFVIGYGLDYDEHYRNLPYIGVLRPSVYGGQPPEGTLPWTAPPDASAS